MNADDVYSLLMKEIDELENLLIYNRIQVLIEYKPYTILFDTIYNGGSIDEIMSLIELNFNELIKLVPHIPSGLLKIITNHYNTISLLVKNDDFSDVFDTFKTISFISNLNGILYGHLLTSKLTNNNIKQKEFYSINGKKGGDGKRDNYSPLKTWAIENAKNLKCSDTDKAKKLALKIPNNLINISKNPERLFYDLIRTLRNNQSNTAG